MIRVCPYDGLCFKCANVRSNGSEIYCLLGFTKVEYVEYAHS